MSGRHRKKASTWSVPLGIATSTLGILAPIGLFTAGASGAPIANAGAPAALRLETHRPASPMSTPTSSLTTPPLTAAPSAATSTPTSTTPSTTASASSAKPSGQPCSTSLAGTKPHVAQVGHHIQEKFDVDNIGGVGSRAGTSDHPAGLALDFMVDTATGNKLADYVLANRAKFGVTYVIWRQRYNDGSGWSTMEDRGGATANHFDHVHVSFKANAKVSVTC